MTTIPDIDYTCDWCSKPFKITQQRLKNINICCSRECAGELKKAAKIPNTVCFICDKPLYIKPSHLVLRKNPTCSKECMGKMRSIIYTGENNHQFGLKGELNSSYKSDFRLSTFGYILVRALDHPKALHNGFVLFHRMVMEEYLRAVGDYDYLENIEGNWYLKDTYDIHHKDENKANNTLANLEILSIFEHKSLHASLKYKDRQIGEDGRFIAGETTKDLYKHHALDAGLDVTANITIIIPARESRLIDTGVYINIPKGFVGLLWSRSGLSVKYRLEVGAGCIDSGYTGEVKVHLYNHSDEDYKVNIGDKIAQLLTIPVNLNMYKKVQFLEDSDRGEKGFGSSGK